MMNPNEILSTEDFPDEQLERILIDRKRKKSIVFIFELYLLVVILSLSTGWYITDSPIYLVIAAIIAVIALHLLGWRIISYLIGQNELLSRVERTNSVVAELAKHILPPS